ncbi:MAG: DUF4349 domain-containing protein [Actinomycetota bacterium]
MSRSRRSLIVGLLLGLLLITAACGGSDADGGASGAAQVGLDSEQPRRAPGSNGTGVSYGGGDQFALESGSGRGRSPATRLPSVGPSVIKTADLGITVEKGEVDGAIQDAIAIAGRHGGFVLATSLDDRGGREARVSLRVPARRFEMAVADLRDLGDITLAEIRGEDVGQEFVDLEARLRNWRTQEAVLLRLMDRATTVAETIRVQGELSSVQLEIERIRGQLRYLQDQTSLSTITAKFSSDPKPAGAPSTLRRAWDRAVAAALAVVAALIVAAGFLAPLALLALIAWLLVRQVRLRLES